MPARLGFAYQVAFARLFDRFPQHQPFELFYELVCFSAARWGLDAGLLYRKRQPTISEHQQTIAGYLRLRPFDDGKAAQLSGITSCFTGGITWIGSSFADAVAP